MSTKSSLEVYQTHRHHDYITMDTNKNSNNLITHAMNVFDKEKHDGSMQNGNTLSDYLRFLLALSLLFCALISFFILESTMT